MDESNGRLEGDPYADLTYNDPNGIKRWIQRQRFQDVLAYIRKIGINQASRLLDYGAGDGELARLVRLEFLCDCSIFEPNDSLRIQAQAKLHSNPPKFFTKSQSIPSGSFDIVFCLEVFEHLPPKEFMNALSEIDRVISFDGIAIIGVPHEIYLPALVKGVFRMLRRPGNFDSAPINIALSTFGFPPKSRPVLQIAPDLNYYAHHLGFDYRVAEACFADHFQIYSKWFSPVRLLGRVFNSEVFFVLKRSAQTIS